MPTPGGKVAEFWGRNVQGAAVSHRTASRARAWPGERLLSALISRPPERGRVGVPCRGPPQASTMPRDLPSQQSWKGYLSVDTGCDRKVWRPLVQTDTGHRGVTAHPAALPSLGVCDFLSSRNKDRGAELGPHSDPLHDVHPQDIRCRDSLLPS